MTKNPYLNAIAALAYIILVVLVMTFGIKNSAQSNSIVIPIVVLSLFTLSAAMMAYIFLSQPVQMYLDGEKKAGVNLFIKTVISFAVITIVLLLVLFSRIFK